MPLHLIPLIEPRFWPQVQVTPDCWLWTGYRSKNGYGLVSLKVEGRWEVFSVHRVSWEMHFGAVPAGLCVCHHCDVKLCVRPDHLFVGTHQDNIADSVRKGRRKGRTAGYCMGYPKDRRWVHSKLTESQVREIRARYAAGGVSQRALAREYGIHTNSVSLIVTRKIWKHLP